MVIQFVMHLYMMERLIRAEILPKLDFSDLDQCVDCIKGKFAQFRIIRINSH